MKLIKEKDKVKNTMIKEEKMKQESINENLEATYGKFYILQFWESILNSAWEVLWNIINIHLFLLPADTNELVPRVANLRPFQQTSSDSDLYIYT